MLKREYPHDKLTFMKKINLFMAYNIKQEDKVSVLFITNVMAYNIKQGDKVGVLFITNAKFMCTYRLLKHWLIAKHMHVSQSV